MANDVAISSKQGGVMGGAMGSPMQGPVTQYLAVTWQRLMPVW
jgi:hypothetical protein